MCDGIHDNGYALYRVRFVLAGIVLCTELSVGSITVLAIVKCALDTEMPGSQAYLLGYFICCMCLSHFLVECAGRASHLGRSNRLCTGAASVNVADSICYESKCHVAPLMVLIRLCYRAQCIARQSLHSACRLLFQAKAL
jgi:hypothetical protein